MSPENKNLSQPAAANLADVKEMTLKGIVDRALADPNATGMQIVDEFVGNLVAADGATSTSLGEHKSPLQVLSDVERVMNKGYKEAQEQDRDPFALLTSNNGLRSSVKALVDDSRTNEFMPFITGALHEGEDGLSLTTPTQVKAYLQAKARAGGQAEDVSWVGRLTDAYENPNEEVSLDDEALRATLKADFKAAEISGVDINMIGRSTEKKRKALEAAQEVGSIVLSPVISDKDLRELRPINPGVVETRNAMLEEVISDPSNPLPKIKLIDHEGDAASQEFEGEKIEGTDLGPEVKADVLDVVAEDGSVVGYVTIDRPVNAYMGSKKDFIGGLKISTEDNDGAYQTAVLLKIMQSLPEKGILRTEGVLRAPERKVWEKLHAAGLVKSSSEAGVPTAFETRF